MNKEESLEWWLVEHGIRAEYNIDDIKAAWNHQAKKIEALEKEIAKLQTTSSASLEANGELKARNAQLIAALKKAEEFMLDISLPNSKRVPSPRMGSALKFLDSPEYQAIKHLLED